MAKKAPPAKKAPAPPPPKPPIPESKATLDHRVHQLESELRKLIMTNADLAAAIQALAAAVAKIPAPTEPLINQAELDAAVQGVTEATAAITAKIPPAA